MSCFPFLPFNAYQPCMDLGALRVTHQKQNDMEYNLSDAQPLRGRSLPGCGPVMFPNDYI